MKLLPTDIYAVRGRSFRNWREIIDACIERRHAIKAILEDRQDWRRIQTQIGMEE